MRVKEVVALTGVGEAWLRDHADRLGARRDGCHWIFDKESVRRIRKPDRFWKRVDLSDPAGCWPWLGAGNPLGYGQARRIKGPKTEAHRIAYELCVGPIPRGLSLHHTCHRRDCVNPDHLEPMNHGDHCRMHFAKPRDPKPCAWCSESYVPKTKKQRFCGMSCRSKWIADTRWANRPSASAR